jgi:hypothetical protein
MKKLLKDEPWILPGIALGLLLYWAFVTYIEPAFIRDLCAHVIRCQSKYTVT